MDTVLTFECTDCGDFFNTSREKTKNKKDAEDCSARGLVHPRSGGSCSSRQGQEGFEEGREGEGFSPGATESQCAENCANPFKIKPSVSSGGARCRSSQGSDGCRPRSDALGDVDMIEKENLERALVRAQSQAVVPPVSEQINEGLHRAGETVGCRRGGSDRGCPESRRVSRSMVQGETFGSRIRVGSPQSSSGRVSRKSRTRGCHSRVSCRTPQFGWRTVRRTCKKPSARRPQSGLH